MTHRKIGIVFEKQAVQNLQTKGYEILYTNWYAQKYGELDIIAKDPSRNTIVFFEVKGRKGYHSQKDVFYSITKTKAKKIINSIDLFLSAPEYKNIAYRFDVILVHSNGIEHLKNIALHDYLVDSYQ